MAVTEGTTKPRKKWSRQIEYIFSVLGWIVGFGNVWRFPYICMINGGGAFLIPFLFFLVLCGIPVFFIESFLGQYSAKPVTKVWSICPLFKGIGVGMIIMEVTLAFYYNTLLGWVLYYLYSSFKSPLPWSHCGNDWNTDRCLSINTFHNTVVNNSVNNASNTNFSNLDRNDTLNLKSESAAEEFWRYKVLRISAGFSDLGILVDHNAVSTLISYVIAFLCLSRGIRSLGKVVYVTAVLPYLLLLAIFIKGLTLPGSLDGIMFYLKPDFAKLLEFQVWIQAAIQVFYSLGPGVGCLITMSSFNKFNNNCLRDTLLLCIADQATSVFAGFAIFSVLGYMAHKIHVPITKVVRTGPGLSFVAFAEALAELPLPNVWAFIFFFAMVNLGLDSQFAKLETLHDAIQDAVPVFKRKPLVTRGVMMAVLYLISLMLCTRGGIYLYQLVDWYVAAVAPILFTFLECILIAWIYGIDRTSRDIRLMLNRTIPAFLRICWCFVTPLILLTLLIFVFTTFKPPHYGSYEYPGYAQVIGWIYAISPIMPLLVCACVTLFHSPGKTFKEKIKAAVQPTKDWKPDSETAEIEYWNHSDSGQSATLLQRMIKNVVGNY